MLADECISLLCTQYTILPGVVGLSLLQSNGPVEEIVTTKVPEVRASVKAVARAAERNDAQRIYRIAGTSDQWA